MADRKNPFRNRIASRDPCWSPEDYVAVDLPKPRWANPSILNGEFAAFEWQSAKQPA